MPFQLRPLPFSLDALEPWISTQTLDLHYNKHHAGYVKKLNELVKETDYEFRSLEDLMTKVQTPHQKIYDNAAQVWNHDFFWACLSAKKKSISALMADVLEENFGSISAPLLRPLGARLLSRLSQRPVQISAPVLGGCGLGLCRKKLFSTQSASQTAS